MEQDRSRREEKETASNMLVGLSGACGILRNMSAGKVFRQRSLTEQVMDYVREATLDKTMVTGEWYSVYQLSEQLGISRSPVRDALLRLEEAGLIRFTRNRGFQIVETRPSDVAEIFALRLGIEPPAAYRAALLRTDEQLHAAYETVDRMTASMEKQDEEEFFVHDRILHEQIMIMGQSQRGAGLVEKLRGHTRTLGASTAGSKRTLADILREHEPILEAISRGSAEIARASMREHLQVTGRLLLEQAVEKAGEGDVDIIWEQHTVGV
ncbi:FCD domain protein [Corynebacterium efficiens YS-314]|nr:FCD domain protein [Corynebacterium efficiens YS-314]